MYKDKSNSLEFVTLSNIIVMKYLTFPLAMYESTYSQQACQLSML